MDKNSVLKSFLIALLAVVLLCSCGESTTGSMETSNLFEYALEIEDGVFSPSQVDFFMSVEEVLQSAGLEEYTVIEKDGGDLIKTSVNIAGFSNDITMYYVFDDAIGNLLCGVRYYLEIVDEADAAEVYDLLYEQAVSAMPDAPGNAIEGIKDGKDVAWEDKEQNYVWLTFFHNKNSGSGTESDIITLQIVATSNASFVPEELKDIMENSMLERSNQERQ
mgnify:CR=1 FL=1